MGSWRIDPGVGAARWSLRGVEAADVVLDVRLVCGGAGSGRVAGCGRGANNQICEPVGCGWQLAWPLWAKGPGRTGNLNPSNSPIAKRTHRTTAAWQARSELLPRKGTEDQQT